MDRWDVLLLAIAAYLAVTSLVRLMANRRNELIGEVREQMQNVRPDKPPPKSPKDQDAA